MEPGQSVRFADPNDSGTLVYGFVAWYEGQHVPSWSVVEAYAVNPFACGRSYVLRGMYHHVLESKLERADVDHYARRSLVLRLSRKAHEGNPLAHETLEAMGEA
jgi:hypothetical protein